jgi:hypothetical protein
MLCSLEVDTLHSHLECSICCYYFFRLTKWLYTLHQIPALGQPFVGITSTTTSLVELISYLTGRY